VGLAPGFAASKDRLAASITLKFSVSALALALTLLSMNSGMAKNATIATIAVVIKTSTVVNALGFRISYRIS
jgi:hypothetical protein